MFLCSVSFLFLSLCSVVPLSLDLGVFGGLIIPAFSFRLSLSSPVYQVSCFVLYTWIRTQPAELPG